MNDIRIGFGYDFHRLTEGTSINLAGIEITSDYKIVAHSDGDIVLHALADAIYGSLSKGDIGVHFPSDDKNKDIESIKIITHACSLLHDSGYQINNVDITIVIEKPHLQDKIDKMRTSLSSILKIDKNNISIKSSTSQKIGLIGNHQAAACYASILIKHD